MIALPTRVRPPVQVIGLAQYTPSLTVAPERAVQGETQGIGMGAWEIGAQNRSGSSSVTEGGRARMKPAASNIM